MALYEATGRVATPSEDTLTAEAQQLQALRDQLSQALAVLSPQNPKVKMLESQLSLWRRSSPTRPPRPPRWPRRVRRFRPGYPIGLTSIGSLLFWPIQGQIVTELEALKASIEATPGNAIALDTLERDYANTRAQYDAAVANKARAETGDTIEALSKGSASRSSNRPLPLASQPAPTGL